MSEEQSGTGSAKLVGAVLQAVRLLQAIEQSQAPLGVSALARAAKVNPSTAFNILRTLVAVDFVVFEPGAKTYRLGQGLLKLSEGLIGQSILDAIGPEVRALATETGSSVGVWQITADRLVLIDRAMPDSPMRLEMSLRHRMPLLTGALGRALAAARGLTDRQLRSAFKTLRLEAPIGVDRYIEEARAAERLGYGVDRGSLFAGIYSVAVVIRDAGAVPVYGITASTIAGRIDEDGIARLGERMAALAQSLAR